MRGVKVFKLHIGSKSSRKGVLQCNLSTIQDLRKVSREGSQRATFLGS